MKPRHSPHAVFPRSLVAFVLAVALAVVASLAQLVPDVTVESVDALPHLPDGIDQIVSSSSEP